MVNNYETVFIVTPVLSEAQVKETVQKFKTFVTKNGAKIVHEEDWGLRKLTYPIQKKSTGFYKMFEYQAEGSLIEKLETECRRDERLIRFLTTRMDKFAVEYAISKRKKKSEKTVEPKKEE